MARFVLEIGTEEIPARFLAGEEEALLQQTEASLADAGITYGKLQVMATPRRLTLIADDIATQQPEKEDVVMGPPAAMAYTADGQPTRALMGFATANDVAIDEVFRQHTDKGEYVAVRKKSGGDSTQNVLAKILPGIISGLPFAKRMRWGSNDIAYARPLRWILALIDSDVIPFKVGPVESGRQTWGHRVHGNGPFQLDSAHDYEKTISEKCKIVVDPAERRKIIREEGEKQANAVGGKILWNDSLLDEVCGLVEHPVPLLADFDSAYLEVPSEALLTSMQSHQKSFGIQGPDSKLLPHFLTVLNMTPVDRDLVKRGWERVLRARLEDARFFWRQDLQDSFEHWLKKLDQVIFIGPLGSMGDKSRRLEQLCEWLAWQLDPDNLDAKQAARAGLLAKADLVSAMVGEFDTLQGIMGGIYADKAGEAKEVAKAISEQYLPTGPDSALPASAAGSILSIADKADTLAGCFGLNMIPTGAADPNGLRRCCLGIIRILIGRDWHLDISELFAKARELYGDHKWALTPEDAQAKLLEFFLGRLRNYFITLGYDTILVDAVVTAGSLDPTDAKARLDALVAFSGRPDYVKAGQTLKRVENMAKKAAERQTDWNNELLAEESEKQLGKQLEQILPEIDRHLDKREYEMALNSLQDLAGPVDNFFDNVLVLCEDENVRENRLKMLNALGSRFGRIAKFSLLQI